MLDNTDIARLRAKRGKKNVQEDPLQGGKKAKKAASPTPSLDSTGMEGWEEAEGEAETDVSKSGSGEESELEGVVQQL